MSKHSCNFCKHTKALYVAKDSGIIMDDPDTDIVLKEEDRNTALKTQKCWLSQSVFNALFNFVFMTSTNNKIQ